MATLASNQPSRRIGRPPEPVPQDKADSLVEWISNGKTLRSWCRIDGNPSYAAVYDWEAKDAVFATRLARARDIGADAFADECVAISDDGSNDYIDTPVGRKFDPENVNRSKLRVWSRLELLKCWNPRKYGARVQVDGTVTLLAESIREARQRMIETDADAPLQLEASVEATTDPDAGADAGR